MASATKVLLEKYWKGETTPAEEQELRRLLKEIPSEFDPTTEQLLQRLDQFSTISLGEDFGKNFMAQVEPTPIRRISWSKQVRNIAAAAVLLIGLGALGSVYFQPTPPPVLAAEEDPEKAYQLATEALLLMSEKLNSAAEYTNELNRFNHTTERIKNKSEKH